MSTAKQPVSLKAVLHSVFIEFGNMNTLTHSTQVDEGNHLSISLCEASKPKLYGKHFLAYHDYLSADGTDNLRKLQVYNERPDSKMFDEMGFNNTIDPALTFIFQAEHPMPGSATSKMKWQKHKGFWITESILTYFGGHQESNFCEIMISETNKDKRFLLLVEIMMRIYGLASSVIIRGHWQREWNHDGVYLKKPSRIK